MESEDCKLRRRGLYLPMIGSESADLTSAAGSSPLKALQMTTVATLPWYYYQLRQISSANYQDNC